MLNNITLIPNINIDIFGENSINKDHEIQFYIKYNVDYKKKVVLETRKNLISLFFFFNCMETF